MYTINKHCEADYRNSRLFSNYLITIFIFLLFAALITRKIRIVDLIQYHIFLTIYLIILILFLTLLPRQWFFLIDFQSQMFFSPVLKYMIIMHN